MERPPKFLVDIFNPIPIRESDYAHCILNNFAEYLTPMLTLGPCSSANLVLDLKMWENLESNLPVWGGHCVSNGVLCGHFLGIKM